MLTAKISIPGDISPTGYILYTHPSGAMSSIIDFEPIPYQTSSDTTVNVIEVYPTGNPPSMDAVASGTILTTRSTFPISNTRIYNNSNLGSEMRVVATEQMEIICNYVTTEPGIDSWDGINQGLENGKL